MVRNVWVIGIIVIAGTLFPMILLAQTGSNQNSIEEIRRFLPDNPAMVAKLDLSTPPPPPSNPEPEQFVPFGLGEKFKYAISWSKVLTAGRAKVEVQDVVDYKGHEVYKVMVEGKSVAPVSAFFRIREELESLIDVKRLFTRRYWTRQDENRKKYERKYEFDQESNSVLHEEEEFYIPYGIHDEVSAVFYIRTLDLTVGKPVYVDIFAKSKSWRVKCDVIKTETLNVPAGEFETIVVEPELHFDGVMKKGKIRVWFTNDQRKIPVQVQSKISLGSILVRLEDYQMSEHVAFK